MFKLVFILFVLFSFKSQACCSAGQVRIFPLGMIQNKPICAVFETSRVCSDDGMGPENEITWFGRMTLQILEKDSLRLFKELDTFEFVECVCDYDEIEKKSDYMRFMQLYLDSAFMVASKEKGYIPFIASVYAADSLSIKSQFTELNDSLAIWKHQELLLQSNESLSCLFMNEIKEIRTYKTSQYELLIATVGCPTKRYCAKENLQKNIESFKKMKNAMTYIPVDWHGYSLDLYLLVDRKTQK